MRLLAILTAVLVMGLSAPIQAVEATHHHSHHRTLTKSTEITKDEVRLPHMIVVINAEARRERLLAKQARRQARIEQRQEQRAAAHAAAQAAAEASSTPSPTSAPTTAAPTYTGALYLTADQVAAYARAAGFPESVIPTMVDIASGESGFCPTAVYPGHCGDPSLAVPGGNACGLWQIYTCPGPDALDPARNAALAYAKYQSSGLSPWGR